MSAALLKQACCKRNNWIKITKPKLHLIYRKQEISTWLFKTKKKQRKVNTNKEVILLHYNVFHCLLLFKELDTYAWYVVDCSLGENVLVKTEI